MQSSRLIPALIFAGATSLWAQLPPSSVTPVRPAATQPSGIPARPAPAAPSAAPIAAPVAPVAPAVSATPGLPPGFPADPDAAPAPASTPSPAATVDLSNTVPNTVTAEETAQGWVLLFDGKRLLGWRGVQKNDPIAAGWKIENGELTLPKSVQQMDNLTGGDLATQAQFYDFEFRFEWRATVSANSGVRYLVNTQMGQPASGLEYQIIDDVHNTISLKGGPLRRSGALDNVIAVGPNAKLRVGDPMMKKADPWNEGRIVVQGSRVEHWLNGEKVVEFTLGPQLRTAADRNFNSKEPMAVRPHATYGMKGRTPIVLCDQGTEVAFRNLKVRALAPQAVAPAGQAASPAYGQRSPIPNPLLLPPKATPQRR